MAIPLIRPGFLAVGALLALTSACEGENFFVGPGSWGPPPPEVVDVRAEILRYVEEGTLLSSDGAQLRFRWMGEARVRLPPFLPEREREAFLRAIDALTAAGGPPIRVVPGGPNVTIEGLPLSEYREKDPTRPWSFSRTVIYSNPQEGIYEAEIFFALDLPQPVLERAAMHAIGHLAGIMSHPAFPGDDFVMATQAGTRVPTSFHAWERQAISFLYSPGVRAGMTREEIRAVYDAWGGGG